MRVYVPKACLLACVAALLTATGALSHGLLNSLGASGNLNAAGNIGISLPGLSLPRSVSIQSLQNNLVPDVMDSLAKTIIKAAPTIQVSNSTEEATVATKIREASSVKQASKPQVEIEGKQIEVPQLHNAASAKKDEKKVGETMGAFAETLQSVTDEDQCDCDPKDSAKSVRKIIDATSSLSQDLLRCLLETLQSTIKPKEATLIRSIVKESMGALSHSVDGIYSIWKIDVQKRDLASVQTVVDGMMSVLNKFSSRLVNSMSAPAAQRVQTISFVVNQVIGLVANTSDALSRDIDSGLSDEQLQLALNLSRELAEPLTSKVLAEFVNGTARIPAINKMVLDYYLQSLKISRNCENSKAARTQLPKSVFKALSQGLNAMTIQVGGKDQASAASEAHRVATTTFLLKLITEIENLLKATGRSTKVSDACMNGSAEALSNVVAIVKKINDDVIPDVKDPKQKQQAAVTGSITKDFGDMITVIGTTLSKESTNNYVANITTLIYQQFEVIRRVAKNDQAIGRDSEAGRKSTITLMVDVSRLEVRYLQLAIERIRQAKNTKLRSIVLRDTAVLVIKSQVTVSRQAAPANNKPLAELIKSSGTALTETIMLLEKSFEKKPRTFGDVMYEVFMALLEVDRKLISSAANPSRSGLATTAPSDVIFGAANAIRTAVDWSNALTRSSGIEPTIQAKLIRYVIEIIVEVETSLGDNEKDNQSLDRSAISDLADVKKQLDKILSDTEKGVTTTTVAADYDYEGDNSEKTPHSGISDLVTLVHKLDEVLVYIIESSLKQPSSVVLRNSEAVINVISVLLEDVSRTPQINDDGSVDLPSGTLKPCTDGTNTDGSHNGNTVSTTPMPSSPETKPPQTTTLAPTTQAGSTPAGRDGDHDGVAKPGHPGHPGHPGYPTTKSPSEGGKPGHPGQSGQPGQPGNSGDSTTKSPSAPSQPGHSGHPTTKGPSGPSQPGKPGQSGDSTTKSPSQPGQPGHSGHPTTKGPSGPSQPGKPGQSGDSATKSPSQPGKPGHSGHPTTKGPSGPSQPGKPGHSGDSTTKGPSGPSQPGKPGQSGDSATKSPSQPGKPGHSGHPTTKGPSGPSQPGKPGQSGDSTTKSPSQPGQPGDSTTKSPSQPGQPGHSGHPTTKGPSGPSQPGKPGQSGDSTTKSPSQPGKPGHSGDSTTKGPSGPSQPGKPGQSGDSTTKSPSQPGQPGHSGHPTTKGPSGPSQPGKPGHSSDSTTKGPSAPSQPGKPGQSGDSTTKSPSQPGKPGHSGHPTTKGPSGPSQPGKPGQSGDSTTKSPSQPGQPGHSGHPTTKGPSGPSQPGKPGHSGHPTTKGPSGPSQPGKPGHSSDSTTKNPSQPGQPGHSGHPTTKSPSGPSQPGKPGHSGDSTTKGPSGPSQPGKPGQSGDSTTKSPSQPGQPGHSGHPTTKGPSGPSQPGKPGHSGDSTTKGPSGPSQPGKPGQSGDSTTKSPSQPGQPGHSGHPTTKGPSGPSQPGKPGQSGDSTTKSPSQPGHSGHPGKPGQPGQPGHSVDLTTKSPSEPNKSGYPGHPGRPGHPGHSGDSKTQNPSESGKPGQPGKQGHSGQPEHSGKPGHSGHPTTKGPGEHGKPGQPGQPRDSGESGKPGHSGQPGEPSEPCKSGHPGKPGHAGHLTTQRPGQSGHPGQQGGLDHGTCARDSGSADKSIEQLLKQSDLSKADVTSLKKQLANLLEKVSKKHCKSHSGKLSEVHESQLLVRVLEDIVKQESCVCKA